MKTLLSIFEERLGKGAILINDSISEKYACDWSRESAVKPALVLRPQSTEEVAFILKQCHKHDQAIVIQGGMTGLSGGATPQQGEIAISLERLNGIEEIDTNNMTLTVKAGTTLEVIQNACNESNLQFPLDLGARGSCQIGGNIATNAGGNQVIRYGMARSLVLGLEVVLADGTVISSMNKLLKNNTGYDLKQLFIGSEGTLGIITRAVLRLYPKYQNKCTALCALESFTDCISLLNHCKTNFADSLESFEVMWEGYFSEVIAHADYVRNPFERNYPFYALIETGCSDLVLGKDKFEKCLESEFENGTIVNATIADNLKQAEHLWQIRDAVAEILPALKNECSFDVGIPINHMQEFLEILENSLDQAFKGVKILTFGHIGDGNLHIIIDAGNAKDKNTIYEMVYKLCQQFSGSVSAEHGIGMLKKPYLHYSRSSEEIQLMRQVKKAFDPKGILNPARVI